MPSHSLDMILMRRRRIQSWLLAILSGTVVGSVHANYCSQVVAPSDSGWVWTTPLEAGVDQRRLHDGLASLLDNDQPAIFASRCGKAFYAAGNISESVPVYSVGKTVVTTWAGILLKHQQEDLEVRLPLSNHPTLAGQVWNVSQQWRFDMGHSSGPLRTLRSFLSMTSAFGLDIVPCTNLSTAAAYSNNAIEFLLSCHIRPRLTQSNESLQHSWLSDVEIAKRLWDEYLNGHEDEISLKADSQMSGYGPSGGLHLSARDAGRLGLSYVDGSVGGRRVLAPDFVAAATTAQVPADAGYSHQFSNEPLWNIPTLSVALPYDSEGHVNTRMRGAVGYGFGIWILQLQGAFHLSGQGGNYVIVDRNSGFVISVLNGQNLHRHPNALGFLKVFRSAMVAQPS